MNHQPNTNPQTGAEGYEAEARQTPVSPRKVLTGAALVLLILVVLAAAGLLKRHYADRVLAARTYSNT